jgi:hypothetical protein
LGFGFLRACTYTYTHTHMHPGAHVRLFRVDWSLFGFCFFPYVLLSLSFPFLSFFSHTLPLSSLFPLK